MILMSTRIAAAVAFVATNVLANAQAVSTWQPATTAVVRAFDAHDIVMLGETHGNKQEYDWLRELVAEPAFADRVDDIVMEFGNSRFQSAVDRYVAGESIPLEEVQGAWLDTVASVGPPSPVYASLYSAVREANLKRRGQHQIRVLCGDPDIDWTRIQDGTALAPHLASRELSYVRIVKSEVLARHRRALLIMGAFHFLRNLGMVPGKAEGNSTIEDQLRAAGARTYLIVTGTNTVGWNGEVDQRFETWSAPVIMPLAGYWVGDLPAIPVILAGRGPQLRTLLLKDAADALLYLGPRDTLITEAVSPSEFRGTDYGRELDRRRQIQMSLEK
jgi:hypothetical protein